MIIGIGNLLAAKTLREKFGGLDIIKTVRNFDEIPPGLERSLISGYRNGKYTPGKAFILS